MNLNKRIRKSGKAGPVRSKKHFYNGITFQSGLELYMWKALEAAGIEAEYESERFELASKFVLENECWERKANGKGPMNKLVNANIRPMTYKPDFIIREPGIKNPNIHVIIETKGRANDAFPLRWKLFKRIINDQYPGTVLFKPQKQAECDIVVERILELQDEWRKK